MKRLPIGLHLDVPAQDYHADCAETPSLSSSIAKVILEQTPLHAWLKHPRLNPNFEHEEDAKFDLGSTVHELILGRGGGIEILPAEFADYRKKDAQQMRSDARASGLTPILAHQYAEAQEIVQRASRALGEIPDGFDQPGNQSEAVLIWQDIGGPLCRAMLDRVGTLGRIWDVKTTGTGLSDAAISRAIVNNGYEISAAFYRRGFLRLHPDSDVQFRWIFVETEPPYETRVIEADATTLSIGDRKAALAIEKWRKALEHNLWVGYPRRVETLIYPRWEAAKWLDPEEMQEQGMWD